MKKECLAASCEHKRRSLFVQLANHASQSQNNKFECFSFIINFFAPFEIFCVYMSANLIHSFDNYVIWPGSLAIMNREPIALRNLLMRARLQDQKVCVT